MRKLRMITKQSLRLRMPVHVQMSRVDCFELVQTKEASEVEDHKIEDISCLNRGGIELLSIRLQNQALGYIHAFQALHIVGDNRETECDW